MVTVNSLSGGKTSSYMAIHYPCDVEIFACVCIDAPECSPTDPAIMKYSQDKLNGNFIATAEHDKTLKVMMDLEQLIGKEIVWVRGLSFDEIIDTNSALPSWNRRFCTILLKIIPIFEYCYFRYGKVTEQIGFRYDEIERSGYFDDNDIWHWKRDVMLKYPISCNNFGKFYNNWQLFHFAEKIYPLIENPTFHSDIRLYWREQHPEIIFPPDSNCMGCHHKPEWLIKKNWLESPKKLEWFSRQEDKKSGKKRFYTWKDSLHTYREIFEMNFEEQSLFENQDFTMCNSGGCTD